MIKLTYSVLQREKYMNKDKLFNFINSLTNSNCSLGLELIIKNSKNAMDYSFFHASIHNDSQKEILSMLKGTLLRVIEDSNLEEFNPMGKDDLTIEKINISHVDGLNEIINLRKDTNNFITNFKALRKDINDFSSSSDDTNNSSDLKAISAYLIEIKNGNDNLKIFRRYSKTKSLSKGILLQMFSEQFSKLDENIFQIDNIIDFIVVNDSEVIVFNRYPFELITNYKDNYLKTLDTALDRISQSNLIHNMEQFIIDCHQSTRIAKQFTKAMQKDSINLILKNIDAVPSVINEADLPIAFIDNQFHYESKEQLSILVALLSDKFARTLIGKKITAS